MDWLTFIIEILKIIFSWPVAVVVMVLLLRTPIAELIPLLRKLKYKDLEISFRTEIEELKEKSLKEIPDISKKNIENKKEIELIDDIKINPRISIIVSWIKLEMAAKKALINKSVNIDRTIKPKKFVDMLEEYKILDENKKMIFDRLRYLKNEATHNLDFYIDPTITSEYVIVANSLTSLIEKS